MLTFKWLLSGNFAQSISCGAFVLPITRGLKWFVSYSTTSTNNNGPQREKREGKTRLQFVVSFEVVSEQRDRELALSGINCKCGSLLWLLSDDLLATVCLCHCVFPLCVSQFTFTFWLHKSWSYLKLILMNASTIVRPWCGKVKSPHQSHSHEFAAKWMSETWTAKLLINNALLAERTSQQWPPRRQQ